MSTGKVTGSSTTWVSTAAELKNVETTDKQSYYKLAEGNTPHDVAVMLHNANPELGDVKTIREGILAANPDIDTDPNHRSDPAYKGKNDYQLDIGQKIKLPANYATALVALAVAEPAASVPTVVTPAPEPTPTAPTALPAVPVTGDSVAAAPTDTKVATAGLNTLTNGGSTEAKVKQPGFGSKVFGDLKTMLDNIKGKQTAAKAERQEEKDTRTASKIDEATAKRKAEDTQATTKTAADKAKLHDFTVVHTDPKYKTVQEYIAERPNTAPDKVLESATKMANAIDARETADKQKVADAAQAKVKADADAKAKAEVDAKTKAADLAKAQAKAAEDASRASGKKLISDGKKILAQKEPVPSITAAAEEAHADMDTARAAASASATAVAKK